MAAPLATFAPGQTLAATCATANVVQWQPLYIDTSADNTVVTSGGAASTLKFRGFARYDGSSSTGQPIEMIVNGDSIAIAGAAITAGANLESAATASRVQTATTGTVIARAIDSAGAAGDLIRVQVLRSDG